MCEFHHKFVKRRHWHYHTKEELAKGPLSELFEQTQALDAAIAKRRFVRNMFAAAYGHKKQEDPNKEAHEEAIAYLEKARERKSSDEIREALGKFVDPDQSSSAGQGFSVLPIYDSIETETPAATAATGPRTSPQRRKLEVPTELQIRAENNVPESNERSRSELIDYAFDCIEQQKSVLVISQMPYRDDKNGPACVFHHIVLGNGETSTGVDIYYGTQEIDLAQLLMNMAIPLTVTNLTTETVLEKFSNTSLLSQCILSAVYFDPRKERNTYHQLFKLGVVARRTFGHVLNLTLTHVAKSAVEQLNLLQRNKGLHGIVLDKTKIEEPMREQVDVVRIKHIQKCFVAKLSSRWWETKVFDIHLKDKLDEQRIKEDREPFSQDLLANDVYTSARAAAFEILKSYENRKSRTIAIKTDKDVIEALENEEKSRKAAMELLREEEKETKGSAEKKKEKKPKKRSGKGGRITDRQK